MYCSNCGTQLPDDANFCLKCGKSVAGTTPKTAEEKWETCEIVCEDRIDKLPVWEQIKVKKEAKDQTRYGNREVGVVGTPVSYKFIVKAIGLSGVSTIEETRHYYMRDDAKQTAKKEIEEMVNRLVKNGWEATGRGEKWYNYKFRRRMK